MKLKYQCNCSVVHRPLYSVHYALYAVHFALYIVHFTLYTVHCPLYTVHCTLSIVHCTLYIIHCTFYILIASRTTILRFNSTSSSDQRLMDMGTSIITAKQMYLNCNILIRFLMYFNYYWMVYSVPDIYFYDKIVFSKPSWTYGLHCYFCSINWIFTDPQFHLMCWWDTIKSPNTSSYICCTRNSCSLSKYILTKE